MTLTLEYSFMKVVDHSVIFLEQLELPNLNIYRRSYGQNIITAQSWKVATLGTSMTVTTRHISFLLRLGTNIDESELF